MAILSGSFTGTGQSSPYRPPVASRDTNTGQFNVFLYGTAVATVQLERSYDAGGTWFVTAVASTSAPIQTNKWVYDSGTLASISSVIEEPEQGILYRLNCTAYTSGTLNYRVSP